MDKKIRDLLEENISKSGFKIDEIEYVKEDNNMVLRIVIDKNGYIDINDCVKVNDIINPILDKEDPIKESYILEVCSKEKGSDNNGR